jgi:proton-dependent oligopeptide transporter, POT family
VPTQLTQVPAHNSAEWFGQPRGLTILFLTDMWEQFSYYGMRAILVYYMTKQLLLAQQHASLIYGLYTAFVFFTPIVGGVISDRWLGRRNAVVIGGSIMALGHFLMTFEPTFFLALATIALGNGLFLPSLPSQIGGLYREDDPRRTFAYNFYYLGVNVGGFLAPFAIGTVGEVYGWHWGFGVAGVGMLIGLGIYLAGGRYLPRDVRVEAAAVVPTASRPVEHSLLQRFALLAGIAAVVVLFRGAYEQFGNTLPLWIETTDRAVGGFVIPMTWFMSINPLIVIVLTPFLVARWTRLARQGRETSPMQKMAFGAGVAAVAYLMIAAVAAWTDANGLRASWLWLVAFFTVITAGELYILPIGLGLFGRLAPLGYSATAIATWFLAAFAGNFLAGAIGTYWSRLSPSGFFVLAAVVAGISGALLLLFNHPVRRAEGDEVAAARERSFALRSESRS